MPLFVVFFSSFDSNQLIMSTGGYMPLQDGIRKVQKELKPTLIANYKVWPLAQILNFAVVPVKLQVAAKHPHRPR